MNRHDQHNSKKAFTLVELLVVVAIIALLLAILLPALGKARNLARLTVCGSNQRQVAMATFTYTYDFSDGLPTYMNYNKIGDGVPVGTLAGSPYSSFMVHTFIQPWKDQWWGQALLYTEGYSGSPKIFYCPGQYPPSDRVWEDKFQRRYDDEVKVGWFGAGYQYNPNAIRETRQWGRNTYVKYLRLTGYKVNDPLVQDVIGHADEMAHNEDGTAEWNFAFSDGHVETRASTEAQEMVIDPNVKTNEWWGHHYMAREALGLDPMESE